MNKDIEKRFRKEWDETIIPVLDEQFPKDNVGVEHLRPSKSRRGAALVLHAQSYIFALNFLKKELTRQRKSIIREVVQTVHNFTKTT